MIIELASLFKYFTQYAVKGKILKPFRVIGEFWLISGYFQLLNDRESYTFDTNFNIFKIIL